MPDGDLSDRWRATTACLEAARSALTDTGDSQLALYREFLDHNELGLALDALTDVADAQRAPRPAWEHLLSAADSMKLNDTDSVHGGTVTRIEAHLTAKHEWFELRALLNEWDPIGIYDPVNDNPPDEYACMEGALMSQLDRGASADDISRYLNARAE